MEFPRNDRLHWEERARNIRLIAMDVDGVLTEGHIVYWNEEAAEMKFFHAHDGIGIVMARLGGLQTAVISQRQSPAVERRARELKVDYLFLKQFYKIQAYQQLQEHYGYADEEICFIGDDVPDLPLLQRVALPVAVQNANWYVKQVVPVHTHLPGGQGAVREVVEFVLQAQGKLEQVIEKLTQPD